MSEFSEIKEENFFIIDSMKLDEVSSKFYGYLINEDIIIYKDEFIDEKDLSGLGSYIYVKDNQENISIFQDLNGSWGLYIYKERDYFAISNSFFRLVEYINNNHFLSLNKDYANSLLSLDECYFSYGQTLANEINVIPRNCVVNINKSNKYISFDKIDYKMHHIPLNSKEALSILDNWFYRWINIIRSLKNKTNSIEFNFDGSLNSRIILLLMLCSNIDLNKIHISLCGQMFEKTSFEDSKIVNEIANSFDFNIKNLNTKKTSFDDINMVFNLPFYIEGGFINKLNYKFYKNDVIIYNFSGIASEMMCTDKFYYNKSFDQIFNDYINLNNPIYFNKSSVEYCLRESLTNIAHKFDIDDINSSELFDLIVYESKCRNYYGKFTVIEYLTNRLFLTPFMDSELHQLKLTTDDCPDKYLVFALIFERYMPELLNFKFKSNFNFDENTLNKAKEINNLSHFSLRELDFISGPILSDNESDFVSKLDYSDVKNYYGDIFRLISFEKEFKKFLPDSFYQNLSIPIMASDSHHFDMLNPIFYMLYFLFCIKSESNLSFDSWIESFFEKNHIHSISSVEGLQDVLDSKSDVSHTHDDFSKEQIRFLQKFLGGNICSDIKFDLVSNIIDRDDVIKFKNIKAFDIGGKQIKINKKKLFIVFDDFPVPFGDTKLNKNEKCYELPAYYLGIGEHKICFKYEDSFGHEIPIFIKDEDNMFDGDVWLGSDFNEGLNGFEKFQVKSISSSNDWSDVGKCSVKVVCDGSSDYQALVTPTQDVMVGDQIRCSVSIFNPESNVTVRLFESSINDFVDVIIPPSESIARVNINKIAKSNRMQLLIIARDKQVFYADNFVFMK
ncbi:hypothetical protein [uncultured Methanobrevibacter sp.]|uniref:hypothetical protein n=1 Tax=uncultured Methanobrevibacter sp. TaxID=253161 RepID=UPI0025F0C41E|nr:hypothetical protein [uncultured Methanobrevibacter sp.]